MFELPNFDLIGHLFGGHPTEQADMAAETGAIWGSYVCTQNAARRALGLAALARMHELGAVAYHVGHVHYALATASHLHYGCKVRAVVTFVLPRAAAAAE